MRWRFIVLIFLGFLSVLTYAQAPIPFISLPLVPDAVEPGSGDFTLTVNGTGFVSNSVVHWNGTALTTQFVTSSQLTATVPAAKIAAASTASVTVVSPAPGGGTSNTAFLTMAIDAGNSVGFGLVSSPPLSLYPLAVLVADFNGDGKQDLAVANYYYSRDVYVLFGDGKGNFQLACSLPAALGAISLATGDFNGDGTLDLAVAENNDSMIVLWLGDGNGKFVKASSQVVGASPTALAAGDFNRDGKMDIAVVSTDPGVVSVLLGDGKGSFTLASSLTIGSFPESIAVGDFNEDGNLDLAVANYSDGSVSILLGDGAGSFTLTSSPAAGDGTYSVAVADFNRDGKLDLAVVNSADSAGSVLLGDGTGNFTLTSSPSVGYNSTSLALGDFNSDGMLDLAAPTWGNGSSTVSVLLGDGTGSFTVAASPSVNQYPGVIAVGDFNMDGRLDLAVGGSALSILLGANPPVVLSPVSLTFRTQLVGTSSTSQILTLTNVGTTELDIASIRGSANFTETNDCGSSVAASASCTISVMFRPRGTGTLAGAVTITDNASNSPQTVSLTGVGTAVTLLPSSLSFGNQTAGTTSKPQTVTLTNYGKKALKISGIHISGTSSAVFAQTNTCGTSVAAGGDCSIGITFTPKSKGSKSATLNVRDDGGASPQTVALTGTGK